MDDPKKPDHNNGPLARLRHHVTGAIERGEAAAIIETPAAHVIPARIAELKAMRRASVPEGLVGSPCLAHLAQWDASPLGVELLALVRAESAALPAVKVRNYTLWTYDVWGNARGGFDVNDRYKHGEVTIACKREIFNAGTVDEFSAWEPTDRQLSKAAGFRRAKWEYMDGEEGGSYAAESSRNGRPVGELILEAGE